MKLADSTWPEVDAFDRDGVVLIPTASLEQHGPHLPLLTDTILATAVAEAVERALP
ncbi:MAG: creatininase family protein, partial [Fimbriimonadaceae bacterium]